MAVFTDSLFIDFDKRNRFVFKVKLKKEYGFATAWTFDRIIAKRKKDIITPLNHVKVYRSLLCGNSTGET